MANSNGRDLKRAAELLWHQHGEEALRIASHKGFQAMKGGDQEEAAFWRKVVKVLDEIRTEWASSARTGPAKRG